jgi:hypothetical protein
LLIVATTGENFFFGIAFRKGELNFIIRAILEDMLSYIEEGVLVLCQIKPIFLVPAIWTQVVWFRDDAQGSQTF